MFSASGRPPARAQTEEPPPPPFPRPPRPEPRAELPVRRPDADRVPRTRAARDAAVQAVRTCHRCGDRRGGGSAEGRAGTPTVRGIWSRTGAVWELGSLCEARGRLSVGLSEPATVVLKRKGNVSGSEPGQSRVSTAGGAEVQRRKRSANSPGTSSGIPPPRDLGGVYWAPGRAEQLC